jgi:virulence factor Mce-like protein
VSEFLRTSTNLVAFGVVTLLLLGYFAFTIGRDIAFDDRYPVLLVLPDSGGLVEDHFVTVMGRDVGRIGHMQIYGDGVLLELHIEPDARVPQHALAHVLRRSAIGEHTINLVPVDPDWEPDGERVVPRFVTPAAGWEAAEPGDEIDARHVVMTVPTRELLAYMEDLFETIPKEELSVAIHELADAFGGRGEVLVDLNRQAHDLNETLTAGIPDFERQLHASRPVLEAIQGSREDIAAMFTHLADLSELLADNRPTMEGLVESSQLMTSELDALIRPSRANLTCLITDLRDYQAVNVANLDWIAQALDLNTYWWHANQIGRQWDPWRPGVLWLRSATLVFAPSTGGSYEERRETPWTKPGAACETPFGVGVNAVRQPDHQQAHPTSPGIDWAPLVDPGEQPEARPAAEEGRDVRAAPADRRRDETPRTGGGGGLALAGLALMAAAVALRARRARG